MFTTRRGFSFHVLFVLLFEWLTVVPFRNKQLITKRTYNLPLFRLFWSILFWILHTKTWWRFYGSIHNSSTSLLYLLLTLLEFSEFLAPISRSRSGPSEAWSTPSTHSNAHPQAIRKCSSSIQFTFRLSSTGRIRSRFAVHSIFRFFKLMLYPIINAGTSFWARLLEIRYRKEGIMLREGERCVFNTNEYCTNTSDG